jgi:hypothetical protein
MRTSIDGGLLDELEHIVLDGVMTRKDEQE